MRRSIKPHLLASSIFRINPDGTWVNLIPIGLILLLGAGLRFYQLTAESVWMDEILSIQDAQEFQLTLPYFLILLAAGFVVIWNGRKPVAVEIAIAYSLAVFGGLFDYYSQ